MIPRMRMFPGDFGLRRCLLDVEQSVLRAEDYNLPDVFSKGAVLTMFNTLDVTRLVEAQEKQCSRVPAVMKTRSYQRALQAYELPQYLTPCPSPVLATFYDRKLRQRMVSFPLETDQLWQKIQLLPHMHRAELKPSRRKYDNRGKIWCGSIPGDGEGVGLRRRHGKRHVDTEADQPKLILKIQCKRRKFKIKPQ